MDCVLGSGPAAVACAAQLLDAGRTVVMIDPNRRLSADRRELIEQFRLRPDRESFVARIRQWRRDLPPALRDKKLPFASPHVYGQADDLLPVAMRDAVMPRSLASGGLSAVWGATVIPMSEASFRDWPVTQAEMAPHYRAVAAIMDVPCPHDDLESLYPNYGDAPPLPLSEQGSQLMSHLVNNRQKLAAAGIQFGRGRSAIGKRYALGADGCTACGLCMYGCPYQAIFSAEYAVDALKQRPGFTCLTDRMAEGFEEQGDGVTVRLRAVEGSARETLRCERLFVACGASTSLRLVADALRWFDRAFYLQDTQQFSIPVLLSQRCRAGAIPQATALSQIFLEIDPPQIAILRARFGPVINHRLLQPVFDRMMIVMGYLPGALSGKISITLRPSPTGGLADMVATGIANPQSLPAIRRIGKKLLSNAGSFGFLPVLPLTEIPAIGTSVHLAACLPMKAAPQTGETDRLGRPCGLRHVHVVDSACFTDLPSEHLTYTIMANAVRIARESTEIRKTQK